MTDEIKTAEAPKPEPVKETSEKSTQESPFEKAEALVKRMEAANKQAADNLLRHEAILSRALLSGKSLAGEPVEKPKAETPQEYANKILSGKR